MQKAGRGALLARATSPAPRCPDAPEPPEPPAAPGPIACSRQSPPDRLLLTCRSGNRGPIARPRGSGSARRGIERPLHCTHCGLALINAKPLPASSSVMALQKLLLTGKRQGKMQLNGLGCLNWSDMVALADVLFDMWTVAGIPDRYFLLQQQEFQDADHPNHRYGNLALLAALLRGWPYSITAEILKHILAKSLARTQPTMHPTQRRSCATLQGESWDWEVRRRVQRRLLGVSSCAIRRRPVPGPHSTN
jgi:hypothetical protein